MTAVAPRVGHDFPEVESNDSLLFHGVGRSKRNLLESSAIQRKSDVYTLGHGSCEDAPCFGAEALMLRREQVYLLPDVFVGSWQERVKINAT